ncbi:MAG: membrane protein insertase YidC, partial [Gammaproteobacteria bacterium]|nr:membrane protein insertase YidC [Gammaproteobacteria bacterium]
MENQRFFLYIALAFLLYIIWLTWQQEHAPAPVAQQDSTLQQNDELKAGSVNNNNYENSDDLPDALDASQANNVVTNATSDKKAQSKSQKVHVRTDVLDVIIDTRGGDIRQIDLPTYPVSLEKKDQAFRLMFSENDTYVAQSGLRHDKINGQAVSGAAPTHHEIYRAEQTEYLLSDGSDE